MLKYTLEAGNSQPYLIFQIKNDQYYFYELIKYVKI